LQHDRVDDVEDVGVNVVLSVKDGDDVALRCRIAGHERVRLVERWLVVDHQPDSRRVECGDGGLRRRDRRDIVALADHDDLQ
jgi:hypothetical protein